MIKSVDGNYRMKIKTKNISIAFGVISIVIAVRLFVFDIYKIRSTSMEPTLKVGDYVILNKLKYGPRILDLSYLISKKRIKYRRIRGFNTIHKNDILVFNYPNYNDNGDSLLSVYGDIFIKRCVGISGESLFYEKQDSTSIDKAFFRDNIVSCDSSFHWLINHYGSIYVPKKGDIMPSDFKSINFYNNAIHYENRDNNINFDSISLRSEYNKPFVFKLNYFFMTGDNSNNSFDSRFWGFLPETHIIGSVSIILFSVDPSREGVIKFRIARILKRLN